MEDCSVNGCDTPKRKLGMCGKHYAADYRAKHPGKGAEYAHNYRETYPERVAETNEKRKDKANAYWTKRRSEKKAEISAANKKWYDKNREELLLKKREYHHANKERINARKREYQKANTEIVNNIQHRRRAKLKSNGVYQISKKELNKLYASPCAYCGSSDKITADHIIPISRGGSHSIGNLAPACEHCNKSKANKILVEWKK